MQVAMSFLLLADYRRGRGRNSLVSMVVALSSCIELSVFVVGVSTNSKVGIQEQILLMEEIVISRGLEEVEARIR